MKTRKKEVIACVYSRAKIRVESAYLLKGTKNDFANVLIILRWLFYSINRKEFL